jgi:hypothetical protein
VRHLSLFLPLLRNRIHVSTDHGCGNRKSGRKVSYNHRTTGSHLLLSYLPLGPSFFATQFHHSYLLPTGTPLRSRCCSSRNQPRCGSRAYERPQSGVPSAMLIEKSPSLEAAANMLREEVVENPVRAETSSRCKLIYSTRKVKRTSADGKVVRCRSAADEN